MLLSKVRAIRKLKLSDICDISSDCNFFVNELLPASVYKLLRLAKTTAAKKSYKNGTINVRRGDGQPPISIKSADDLASLV